MNNASEKVMTSKEYTVWLETSLATALNTLDALLKENVKLTRDYIILAEELSKNTKAILNSPYTILHNDKEV